jgi:hypothetical protein
MPETATTKNAAIRHLYFINVVKNIYQLQYLLHLLNYGMGSLKQVEELWKSVIISLKLLLQLLF